MEYEIHIGKEIKRLDNEIHSRMQIYRAAINGDELTMMQSMIIRYMYLNRDRDLFQKDIEAHFSIARSTATGILQLMEKKEYIRRECVERDARLKKLVLLPKSIQQVEHSMKCINQMETLLRKDISQEDLHTFFKVIQKMRMNVEQDVIVTDRRREEC